MIQKKEKGANCSLSYRIYLNHCVTVVAVVCGQTPSTGVEPSAQLVTVDVVDEPVPVTVTVTSAAGVVDSEVTVTAGVCVTLSVIWSLTAVSEAQPATIMKTTALRFLNNLPSLFMWHIDYYQKREFLHLKVAGVR